jgi:prepilin-type N-terminal cleavage/methylation domain-containing protein/prepilin-type processing-associated H-X9-DG protein
MRKMNIKKGFTLIELLVVIAIIGLLLSIIIPSLNMAKRKATSAVCMTNVKNMSLGWYSYQEDHHGRIMSARMEDVGSQSSARNGWIGAPHTASDTSSTSLDLYQVAPPVTDEDEIRGIEQGVLFPYLKSSNVYHCPGDKLRLGPDSTRLYVSYCVPECLYGRTNSSDSLYNKQIIKFNELTSPGMRYNFVESGERVRGNWIAAGHFVMATPEYGDGGYGWWSPIAINHGDSSVFGFCDGHASIQKWHDQDTFEHYAATQTNPSYGKRMPTNGQMGDDLGFLARGWPYRARP